MATLTINLAPQSSQRATGAVLISEFARRGISLNHENISNWRKRPQPRGAVPKEFLRDHTVCDPVQGEMLHQTSTTTEGLPPTPNHNPTPNPWAVCHLHLRPCRRAHAANHRDRPESQRHRRPHRRFGATARSKGSYGNRKSEFTKYRKSVGPGDRFGNLR